MATGQYIEFEYLKISCAFFVARRKVGAMARGSRRKWPTSSNYQLHFVRQLRLWPKIIAFYWNTGI